MQDAAEEPSGEVDAAQAFEDLFEDLRSEVSVPLVHSRDARSHEAQFLRTVQPSYRSFHLSQVILR
jgi:hypothetical protein